MLKPLPTSINHQEKFPWPHLSDSWKVWGSTNWKFQYYWKILIHGAPIVALGDFARANPFRNDL